MLNYLRNIRYKHIILTFVLVYSTSCYAQTLDGGVDYGMSTQALAKAHDNVLAWMYYTVMLLYAIASLCAIYNATVIYIKLQTGEGGFTKSVLMLLGAVLFILGSSIFMPAIFNYRAYSDYDINWHRPTITDSPPPKKDYWGNF